MTVARLDPDSMPKAPAQHRTLGLVLALSLLAHAALLSWPIDHEQPPRQHGTDRISLVALPLRPTPAGLEAEVIEPPVRDDTIIEPDTPAPQTPEVEDRPGRSEPEPAEPTGPDAAEIRRQALQLAGDSATRQADDAGHNTLSFRAAPRLPGASGWLDQHVVTVTASRQQWRSVDGGHHSRIVASNGRVVCASIRPPTMQEFFNPSMSAAVTMLRDCGRERPRSRSTADPWHRAVAD